MDQVTVSPTRSSAFFGSRQDDTTGNTYTSNVLSGLTAMKALANEGPVSRVVDTKVSQQHVMAANRSVSAAKAESIAASNEKAAALSEVLMNASMRTASHNASAATVSGSTESEGERIGELQQIAKNISKATGATEQQVAAVAFGGSAHFGAGIPSAISPVDGGALISATGRKNYSASIQQQDQLITNALSSEDKAKFKSFADTVTKNAGVVDSLVSDSKSGHDLSAKLARSVSRSERADANLRTQVEFSESISGAYQRGESVSKDVAKDPRNIKMFEDLLRLESAGSAAELIKMESYIGNITSVPHQLSASSSLPQSFGDVERAHKRNVDQLPANIVSDQFKKDGAQVKSARLGSPSSGTSFNPDHATSMRSEIAKVGRDAKDMVRNAESAFHSKAGVVVDKDGHIFTHRSLFGDANEQVRNDPDVVAEKAKELALRLAKMARKGE